MVDDLKILDLMLKRYHVNFSGESEPQWLI